MVRQAESLAIREIEGLPLYIVRLGKAEAVLQPARI